MSLFERNNFEAMLAGLPAVQIVHQWGDASVGKVGGKIFAMLSFRRSKDRFTLSFKCSDLSFNVLADFDGITPARYLARAKWVDVAPESALGDEDIAAYVAEAHRLIGARLPRHVRAALGLTE